MRRCLLMFVILCAGMVGNASASNVYYISDWVADTAAKTVPITTAVKAGVQAADGYASAWTTVGLAASDAAAGAAVLAKYAVRAVGWAGLGLTAWQGYQTWIEAG